MRKIFTKLLVPLFLLLIISASCDKEVENTGYPKYNQKIVISGFLSPDNKVNRILVSENLSLYGDRFKPQYMGNLTATISDGINELSLDSAQFRNGFTSSDYPIIEGKTYTLTVKTDIGLSAEASCTVPLKSKLSLEIDTSLTVNYNPDYGSYTYVNSNIYFTDVQGIDNYYMLYCEQVDYISKWSETPSVFGISGPEKAYFTDKGKDGMRSKITLQPVGVGSEVDSSYLKVYLLNTDKAYYDYKKSLDNYNSGDDPFTEPSPVYTNITGGLGIFAAFTIDSLIFRLK
jgi:hypothetical protein